MKRVLAALAKQYYELPCGFEPMMKEEGLELPQQYPDDDWYKPERPEWVEAITNYVPKMSDKLLLDVWEQILCLLFR